MTAMVRPVKAMRSALARRRAARDAAARRAAAERLSGLFADVAPGRSLVDELIADRRAAPRAGGARILSMVVTPTTTVEIDSELLERLRSRHPGRSDRELIETLAKVALGRVALRRVQERNTLPEQEAVALGVAAVHEARHDQRRAAG
jgi:hypothetical protein